MAAADFDRYQLRDEPVELVPGRHRVRLEVANTGDRPIQVGSHFHFFEANRALRFDRAAAFGMRLDVLAGTAVRFEPGDVRDVDLVALGGLARAHGFHGATDGSVRTAAARRAALERLRGRGFDVEAHGEGQP